MTLINIDEAGFYDKFPLFGIAYYGSDIKPRNDFDGTEKWAVYVEVRLINLLLFGSFREI